MKHDEAEWVAGDIAALKFTPLEFETREYHHYNQTNSKLKFTPLEFETNFAQKIPFPYARLKFTPLEFETLHPKQPLCFLALVKIYSVGV